MPIHTPISDLIFEYRNKAYGAYELRLRYPKNILIAVIVANLLISLLLIIFYFSQFTNSSTILEQNIDYRSDLFSVQEVQIPKLIIEKNEQVPNSAKEIITNANDKNTSEVNKEASNKIEGTKPNISQEISTESQSAPSVETLQSTSSDTVGTEYYSQEIYMTVDTKASFAGGEDAFLEFLKKNIILPEYVLENKISALIYVHLVVNTDGSLEDIKLYKGIEKTCNEEVLRVIKLSPNWIAALKNGTKVRQRIIIAVKLAEDQ